MRTESPEERGRQKVAEPPSYRIENEYNPEAMPQYFQISVGVLEGRNYTWLNPRSANSYVVVSLGKKKFRTNMKRNKQEPQYRECFTFDMYASVLDLQRSTLCLTVMEPRCCAQPRLLGESNIELGAVWRQSYYQIFRKWVQLSLPRDPSTGCAGFLKVNISITCKAGITIMPPVREANDVIVNNLMLFGSEQQPANFIITVHGAFDLSNACRHRRDRHHCAKPLNTFVRVLFFGLEAKTAVQNSTNNPVFNEQVSMVEMFPSSNLIITFEVCSTDTYICRHIATVCLNLDYISHDGENGFLPTFGPSLLPMYASCSPGNIVPVADCPYYRGSLLVSVRSVMPYYQQGLRSVSIEPVVPIPLENYLRLRSLCIFCPIFEVSMLESRLVGNLCGVALTIGEIPITIKSDEEFSHMMNEIKTRKLHYTGSLHVMGTNLECGYLEFSNTYPVLLSTTRLPDYRFRMYRNNEIQNIINTLESLSKEVQYRLSKVDYISLNELLEELDKGVDQVASGMLHFLGSHSTSKFNNKGDIEQEYRTDLDEKQLILQTEEMKKIYHNILQRLKFYTANNTNYDTTTQTQGSANVTRKTIKCLLSELHKIAGELEKLISYKATEGWPDLVIWLLNNGSRIGFCKITTADILFSESNQQRGRNCGRIQTIYFKALKCSRHINSMSNSCSCVVGKVEFLAWMGLHEQKPEFEQCLPTGYKLKVKNFDMSVKCNGLIVEYRAFVYKARLFCHTVGSKLGHVFLRLNTLNTVKDTKAVETSCNLVWNQMLTLRKMIFTSSDRLMKYPPVVFVEIYSADCKGTTDLIGNFQMKSVVQRNDSVIAPKPHWYEIYKGMECIGKVLMSVQILEVPETILKTTIYNPFRESLDVLDKKLVENSYKEELLPSLIPDTSNYKVDIYWWGYRNGNITKKPFAVLEIQDITIKSEVITDKKSNCNFPNGQVSQTFESCFSELFSPSIIIKLYDSCTFGRTLYLGTKVVKRPNKYFINCYPKAERQESLKRASIFSADFVKVSKTLYIKKRNSLLEEGNMCISSGATNIGMKRSRWRRLFCRKEPDEEEYTLLPSLKEKCINNIVEKDTTEIKDWWSIYLDALTIYDSELERQPQFSKFKDWCATLKLYSGEKTGITEKDEEMQCGQLKVGIAIYKWPPSENRAIVSSSGVDLNRGYFHDYPKNEPAKFLIRVYVVKAINLKAEVFSGKPNPYVVINCGRNNLSDRNRNVPNTFNPVFGVAYEFQCTLPEDSQLTVSLYNHDLIEPDELIGSTTIDLEDRIYTKHRARVGLASHYNMNDPGKWRDHMKPSEILIELCAKNHLPPVNFPSDSTVSVNGVEYENNEKAETRASALERREDVCLSLLRNWDTLPICGHPLVPEHVETRSLYNPEIPGIDQGKIHMWVDIFPVDYGICIPPLIDITPRKAEEYVLRLTVLDVKLFSEDKKDNFSNASNLYIRAWTGFADQVQNTKYCSISPNGYYVFNWRMTFNFKYQVGERKLIRKENQLTHCNENVDPHLVVQLMDSDTLSVDEPLGCLTLNLIELPQGANDPENTVYANHKAKNINLFSTNNIGAWWSLGSNIGSKAVGAIKLELSLLPKSKIVMMTDKLERDLQPPPLTGSRLRRNSFDSNNDFKNFFYKHNALWGSLTGISIVILIVIVIIYFIYCTI